MFFTLNRYFRPNYGECLMKLGLNKEAIKAYEKSVELNPKNKKAKEKINKLKSVTN